MDTQVKIREIFSSIQGEGPIVGCKQLFIRFCGCNLKCEYCDTDFEKRNAQSYTPMGLYNKIIEEYDLKTFHSISLTGGEPLLSVDFLVDFLPLIARENTVYLETNATLYKEFCKIKNYVDIVSADIKLPSCSGINVFEEHKKFFEQCRGIQTFAKIVFDKNITQEEIETSAKIASNYGLEIILQPMMVENKISVNSLFCTDLLNKYTKLHKNTRLIPQVHKFIDVR